MPFNSNVLDRNSFIYLPPNGTTEFHPTVVLLNFLTDMLTSRSEKTLITFLLFYTKKANVIKWKEEHPPNQLLDKAGGANTPNFVPNLHSKRLPL